MTKKELFEQYADTLLRMLDLGDELRPEGPVSRIVDPKVFDGAIPMLDGAKGTLATQALSDEDYLNFFTPKIIAPRDLDKDWDITLIAPCDNGIFGLMRFRATGPQRLRGMHLRGEHFCESHCLAVFDESKMEYHDSIGIWSPGEHRFRFTQSYHRTRGNHLWIHGVPKSLSIQAGLAMSASYTAHFFWSVYLGRTGSKLRLRLFTDPQGAKAAFRWREIKPGYQRRTALAHWVRAHHRQQGRRSDEVTETRLVEAYLRGDTAFEWNGLTGLVVPSQYDLNRYKKLHQGRATTLITG